MVPPRYLKQGPVNGRKVRKVVGGARGPRTVSQVGQECKPTRSDPLKTASI
jgi:hypothetical protein